MFVFATNYSYLKEYQNQPKSESAGTTKKKKKEESAKKNAISAFIRLDWLVCRKKT